LKKPVSSKRTSWPRDPEYTSKFTKDWDRLTKAARFDMPRLKEVMMLLIANDGPLDAEWKDHDLKGKWQDCRDCHVHGDFILIYKLEGNKVIFTRAGTHAELFK
jgi:mRNA interferase YafQ